MTAPKLFISYSWSSPAHEEWVINLASQLRSSGVDAILDKWDLKEGQDAIQFMEQMVTSEDITKVVMICDNKYVAKADSRDSGVGIETQIISKEVYSKKEQSKFVAVVVEKDPNGNAYLPTYYKSRIYIDLCENDLYTENFDKLLRWIFDQPLYVKPELGTKPGFLDDTNHISLGTTASFKRCHEAIKSNKPTAQGAYDDFCTTFTSNMERFRLPETEGALDDEIIKNIDAFLPFRNEAINLFNAIAQYAPESELGLKTHRFLEKLIPFVQRPGVSGRHTSWDEDNFKFIVHELFLYALAIFIKHERFVDAQLLLEQQYFYPVNMDTSRNKTGSFTVFRQYIESLRHRNDRLNLGRISLRADLLKKRCEGSGVELKYLLQADFVAFLKAEIDSESPYEGWWPETLVFIEHARGPCEVFARSISKGYFERSKRLIGIEYPNDLEQLLTSYDNRTRRLPSYGFDSLNPRELLGYEKLATKP